MNFSPQIKDLLENTDSIFNDSEKLSCGTVVFRNIAGFPFESSLTDIERSVLQKQVLDVLNLEDVKEKLPSYYVMMTKDLSSIDINLLEERKLLNKEQIKEHSMLLFAKDGTFSMLLNGLEHIMFRFIDFNSNLDKVADKILDFEKTLSAHLTFLWEPKFGYLMENLRCLGCGFFAWYSLCLYHMDSFQDAKSKYELNQKFEDISLQIDFYYRHQKVQNLYVISNLATLGQDEFQIIKQLKNASDLILQKEKHYLDTMKPEYYMDNLSRAYSTLKYSYYLSFSEMLGHAFYLKKAIQHGIVSSISISDLMSLVTHTSPAHLNFLMEKKLTAEEQCIIRAKIFRDNLGGPSDLSVAYQ